MLLFPPLVTLFALYMRIGFARDSTAQAPGTPVQAALLLSLAAGIVALFLVLTFVDIPLLAVFTEPHFISVVE
jgi:hypothetical protein